MARHRQGASSPRLISVLAFACAQVDAKTLAARAKKVNRSRLMYAGMFLGTQNEEKFKF